MIDVVLIVEVKCRSCYFGQVSSKSECNIAKDVLIDQKYIDLNACLTYQRKYFIKSANLTFQVS